MAGNRQSSTRTSLNDSRTCSGPPSRGRIPWTFQRFRSCATLLMSVSPAGAPGLGARAGDDRTRRNVPRDHRAGAYDRPVPDRHSFQDGGSGSDPDTIAYADGPVVEAAARERVLVGVHDQHIPPDHAVAANGDLLPGDDLGVPVEVGPGPDAEPAPVADFAADTGKEEAVSSLHGPAQVAHPDLREAGHAAKPAGAREAPGDPPAPESVSERVAPQPLTDSPDIRHGYRHVSSLPPAAGFAIPTSSGRRSPGCSCRRRVPARPVAGSSARRPGASAARPRAPRVRFRGPVGLGVARGSRSPRRSPSRGWPRPGSPRSEGPTPGPRPPPVACSRPVKGG